MGCIFGEGSFGEAKGKKRTYPLCLLGFAPAGEALSTWEVLLHQNTPSLYPEDTVAWNQAHSG